MIDEDLPHQPRGQREEVGAASPVDGLRCRRAADRLRGSGRWSRGCDLDAREPCIVAPVAAGPCRRGAAAYRGPTTPRDSRPAEAPSRPPAPIPWPLMRFGFEPKALILAPGPDRPPFFGLRCRSRASFAHHKMREGSSALRPRRLHATVNEWRLIMQLSSSLSKDGPSPAPESASCAERCPSRRPRPPVGRGHRPDADHERKRQRAAHLLESDPSRGLRLHFRRRDRPAEPGSEPPASWPRA